MGRSHLALCTLVAVACTETPPALRLVEPPAFDPPLGVAIGAANIRIEQLEPAMASARDAGAIWVRLPLSGVQIEPQPGRFDWSWPDAAVAAARSAGLRPVGMIFNTPRSNTSAPDSLLTSPPKCNAVVFSRYPPRDDELWRQHVGRIVERFSADIKVWEVWNEPDLDGVKTIGGRCNGTFWCGTPAQYARLLAITAGEIRRRDPSARVMLGGLAMASNRGNPQFLRDILGDSAHSAGKNFDIMNFHYYGPASGVASSVGRVKAELAAAGLERPVWITETGLGSNDSETKLEEQRAYVEHTLAEMVTRGVRTVFWFRLVDPSPVSNACSAAANPGFGLLRSDLTRRPAYHALAALARRLKGDIEP